MLPILTETGKSHTHSLVLSLRREETLKGRKAAIEKREKEEQERLKKFQAEEIRRKQEEEELLQRKEEQMWRLRHYTGGTSEP